MSPEPKEATRGCRVMAETVYFNLFTTVVWSDPIVFYSKFGPVYWKRGVKGLKSLDMQGFFGADFTGLLNMCFA